VQRRPDAGLLSLPGAWQAAQFCAYLLESHASAWAKAPAKRLRAKKEGKTKDGQSMLQSPQGECYLILERGGEQVKVECGI